MWVRPEAYPVEYVLENDRLGFKGLIETNALAYRYHSSVTKKKKCCEYNPRGPVS
jgi:hypothetical protein